MVTALIVDDDTDNLLALSEVFRNQGFATETAETLSRARDSLLRRMPDVTLVAERIGDENSLDMLAALDLSRVVEIYLMSSERSIDTAARAMQLGVSDYFDKPVDTERLADNLKTLSREIASEPPEVVVNKSGRGLLVGETPPMQRLLRLIRKCAPSEASVFLAGESGSGKDLVAQTLHALSSRASGAFVPLNCSAINPELMESELFGHVKGSFTGATRNHRGFFQRASGGTLFLDEITEMAPALQAKLLRVLETKRITPVGSEKEIAVDARIVAATNQDTRAAVEQGRLREDLYYRLAQFPIRIPPLRERGDDIALLAAHFLEQQNERSSVTKSLSAEVVEALRLHDWPGNVRELKNAIVHGHLLAGNEILIEDLPDGIPGRASIRGDSLRIGIGMSLSEVEQRLLLSTLAYYDDDKKKTAEVLGISLKTLYNRLKKYSIK